MTHQIQCIKGVPLESKEKKDFSAGFLPRTIAILQQHRMNHAEKILLSNSQRSLSTITISCRFDFLSADAYTDPVLPSHSKPLFPSGEHERPSDC